MTKVPGVASLGFDEPVIFEKSSVNRKGSSVAEPDVPSVNPETLFSPRFIRESPADLPELSEPEVVRHFTRLSSWNFSIDHGFYPLGSCTMKYNPKISEWAAGLSGFASLHPYSSCRLAGSAIRLIYNLEKMLAEISGMSGVSLQPAAGAHGELTALMIIRKAHVKRGNPRKIVLVPDTAHGTNPASCSLNGYSVVSVSSSQDGLLDIEDLASKMNEDVAALMLTNPNTLGLFEKNISEICSIVHNKGGFVFGDGANLNAIMAKARPGDFGVDAMQFNLHKTFSTPHGGGGPGSGPVGVSEELVPYLPVPRPVLLNDNVYVLDSDFPDSIGRVRSFVGNFGVMVKAYAYLMEMGAKGLEQAAGMAVLNANYLLHLIKDTYHIPFGNNRCMHEVVASDKYLSDKGVSTLDVAKGLIDRGFHPPTIYFPLIVKGALMLEPTETESKETIEEFASAMIDIAEMASVCADELHSAPLKTRLGRLDETLAARKPVLKY
jgi:glycine dehydrogenase subunit 2